LQTCLPNLVYITCPCLTSPLPAPPRHPLPEWYVLLRAKSFADRQAKFNAYVKNAQANLEKAPAHPVDPDRFRDTKYSSAAGQYGYLAAMIQVDGF
jgi:hypothetical protein